MSSPQWRWSHKRFMSLIEQSFTCRDKQSITAKWDTLRRVYERQGGNKRNRPRIY